MKNTIITTKIQLINNYRSLQPYIISLHDNICKYYYYGYTLL